MLGTCAIADYIKCNGPMTARRVALYFSVSDDEASGAIATMISTGELIEAGRNGFGKMTYALAEPEAPPDVSSYLMEPRRTEAQVRRDIEAAKLRRGEA